MKQRITTAVAVVMWALLATLANARAAESAPGAPAVWMHYNLIVDLDGLRRHNSCDQLWLKFRDALWLAGARGLDEILPYDCQATDAAGGHSPRVHVEFYLPRTAPANGRAELMASKAVVRLAAGQPSSFTDSDCQLLQLMRDTLFAALPVTVVRDDLQCAGAGEGKGYGLTLEVLQPLTSSNQ